MSQRSTHGFVLVATICCAFATTACSGGVTPSTKCSDFLQMDEQTQLSGVQTLAARSHGSAFKGPMGINNVVYDCQETPNKTIGAIMGVS